MSDVAPLEIILVLPAGERTVYINNNNVALVPTIATHLGVGLNDITVSFCDCFVDYGLTAEDCCIVNNSRLTVTFIDRIITKKDFRLHILKEMLQLNQHLTIEDIMKRIQTRSREEVFMKRIKTQSREDDIIFDINFDNINLQSLPESFGRINVSGSLRLQKNKLKTLPESFGNIVVGCHLELHSNELQTLPESFGHINVPRSLTLYDNQLHTLPESFGNITVGWQLLLNDGNQIFRRNNASINKPDKVNFFNI